MNQEKEQNHENAPAVSEESKTAASEKTLVLPYWWRFVISRVYPYRFSNDRLWSAYSY